jgi:hypothetical protein
MAAQVADTATTRRQTPFGVIAVLGLILTGCSAITFSARPSAPPSSSATASPTGDPTPPNDRVVIDCSIILSDAHAAELTPSLTPVPAFTPSPGTLGATMVAEGGRPCGWGAGATASLEVVAAIPTPAGLTTAKKAAASTGQLAHFTQADAAYFEIADGIGRAQIFMGSYWIEVASSTFTTAEQAENVYSVVINDLRSAGG